MPGVAGRGAGQASGENPELCLPLKRSEGGLVGPSRASLTLGPQVQTPSLVRAADGTVGGLSWGLTLLGWIFVLRA